jgi:3-oxoacyl-[acyl-carrier-protein] synthase-1
VGRDVVVVGMGMITAVGLSAAETAASVRARTMRFSEIAWRDKRLEPFTVAEVLEEGLPGLEPGVAAREGLSDREERLLRLGILPLRECLGPLGGTPARGIGLRLALPDLETQRPLRRARLLELLAEGAEGAVDVAASDAGSRGRAGGLAAVGQAGGLIREGKADLMIVGGIDTYRALHALGTLDRDGRVKSSSNLDGFIPGEGAGFLLLASAEAARKRGLEALARVSAAGESFEPGHLYAEEPYRGEGLASALAALVQEDVPKPFREVYSSMNGESHWAKEWGVAVLRHRDALVPDHGLHHPADCFGDTGAACGPLLVGLAAAGLSGGYRKSPCLVYCSSDRGERAAVVVSGA